MGTGISRYIEWKRCYTCLFIRSFVHDAERTGVYRWNADAPKCRKARYLADRLCPTETNRLPVGAPRSNWIRGWWPTLLAVRRYVVYDRVARVSRKKRPASGVVDHFCYFVIYRSWSAIFANRRHLNPWRSYPYRCNMHLILRYLTS